MNTIKNLRKNILNSPLLNRIYLGILGGISILGFAPYNLVLLSIFSISTLFAALISERHSHNNYIYKSWLDGLAFGFGFFAVGLWGLVHSISIFGDVPLPLAIIGELFVALIQGIYFSLGVSVFGWFNHKINSQNINNIVANTSKILIFATVMSLCEWIRTTNLTGASWLFFGYIHTETFFNSLAPLIGVTGLSWLTFAISASFYLLGKDFFLFTKTKKLKNYYLFFALLFSFFVFVLSSTYFLQGIQWTKPTGKSLNIMAIQGNRDLHKKWYESYALESLKRYEQLALSPEHNSENINLVIFPETFMGIFFEYFVNDIKKTTYKLAQKNISLMFGQIEAPNFIKSSDTSILYNSIFTFDSNQRPVSPNDIKFSVIRKENMILFGEYTPLWISSLANRILNIPFSNIHPANKIQKAYTQIQGMNITPIICYDIAFSGGVVEKVKNSEAIVEVSEEAWFGSSNLQAQHLQIAQMRALETHRPIFRVTNNGISAILSANGKIVSKAPAFSEQVLVGSINGYKGLTPWMKYHNKIIFTMWLFTAIFAAILIFRHQK